MKSSLSDAQDRILKGFSHEAKGSSANSAVAQAIEAGKRNPKAFDEQEDTGYSFASPEFFLAYITEKKAKEAAEKARRAENKKKKK
jgi:hypothetical protein